MFIEELEYPRNFKYGIYINSYFEDESDGLRESQSLISDNSVQDKAVCEL